MAIENLDFRINAAIDAGNSAKTLGDLKTSLKELRDLAAQAGPENADQFNKLTTAAGQVNDKIKDVRESVQALSGTPMERLGNSFSRLRQSIFEMDLEKFKLSLIGIKDSFVALGAQALAPFRNLGVAISGLVTGTTTLTAAMRALGGAIAATGIGALVVSVGLLVAYWDELKTAGGLIGNTFQFVADMISSATNALAGFARQVGLIGPPQQDTKKEAEDRKKRAEDVKKSVEAEIDAFDKKYEQEKKLREANRKEVGRTEEETSRLREKYRKEDLQAELEYRKSREQLIKSGAENQIKAQLEANKVTEKQLKKDVARIRELSMPSAGEFFDFDERDKRFNELDKILKRYGKSIKDYLVISSKTGPAPEFTEKLNNLTKTISEQQIALKDYEENVKPDLVSDAATEIIKIENDLADTKQEIQNNASKNKKKSTKDEKIEIKKSELQFLEEMAATEDNFLKKRLKVQEDWNRSAEEIDAMYREISLEGEYTKSEDIFTEIDRRLQYQSDANEKARVQEEAANLQMKQNKSTQFDLENLMISRNHDVFSDEMNYRIEIDNMYADIQAQNATWTSEMIYEEIRRRLQYQIDAYDAEKQAAIDKTNAIIDTARYGAQALDGINQFIYTLDENRRIAGEMSEKEVALRAFKRQQAFGMVNAAINTASGITAVLASPANKIDPTGTLMNLQIAFISLAGAAQIAAIASQKFDPNSFGSTPDTPSAKATLPTSVAPGQFVPFTEFKPGDLEERRVYVVESDITGIQRKVQVIENRSKF